MENEADGVIKPLVVAEGVVAALMGDDPDAGEDAALDSPVDWPGQERERPREEMEVMGSHIIEAEGYGEVVNDVGERARQRTVETVRRQGLLDLTHRERWLLRWASPHSLNP